MPEFMRRFLLWLAAAWYDEDAAQRRDADAESKRQGAISARRRFEGIRRNYRLYGHRLR